MNTMCAVSLANHLRELADRRVSSFSLLSANFTKWSNTLKQFDR